MFAEDEKLAAQCRSVAQAISGAVTWIGANSARIGQGGEVLARELRKSALIARHLETAAQRKMCVGVFGPSQSGKSYLISALARPGDEPLLVNFAGTQIDFIREINPEGGRESTGLVTRFTLDRPAQTVAGFPVELRLLTQTDLVKIIGNTFYADCRHDDWPDPEAGEIAKRVEELARAAAPAAVDGLSEADVYDLEEYFWRYFRGAGRVKVLKHTGFWNHAAQLAPRLKPAERARLFALVWGDVEAFTQLYQRLYLALHSLDFAQAARCPLDALQPRERSLIDVQTLAGLGTGGGDRVRLLAGQREVELPRNEITALTAEIKVVLEARPYSVAGRKPYDFFDHTDLLDFPGARSREQIKDLAEYLARPNALQGLFLRGKVAYLFERYCAEQELTSLLLCIGPGNQEVRGLPDMISDWIGATHGATPEERNGRPVSLFLVLSKFDMEFEQKAGATGSSTSRWSARLYSSLLDFFGKQHDWPKGWDREGGFRNTFWLRNPNFKQKAIFDYRGDREENIRNSELAYIQELRAGFMANDEAKRHFANPAVAWDAAMALNDGGVSLLAERLSPVCNPELKRQQVAKRLADVSRSAMDRLRLYYISDDIQAERAKKREQARGLAQKLVRCAAAQRFGEFLQNLHVSDEALYDVYFLAESHLGEQADEAVATGVVPAEIIGTRVDEDDLMKALFGDPEPAKPVESAKPMAAFADAADKYTHEVIAYWLAHLREFSDDAQAQTYFGFTAAELGTLVHELMTGCERLNLRPRIAARVREISQFRTVRREQSVWKQAATAAALLNRYIDWLGFDPQDEVVTKPVLTVGGRQRPLFAPRPPVGTYPLLGKTPSPYDQDFYADWLYALTHLIEGNVGPAGAPADSEQNRRLGEMLDALKAVNG